MKKEYISPFTEIIIINNVDLLFDDWHSVRLDGTLPGGDQIGDGGDGDEEDEELLKINAWGDSDKFKNLWE